MTPTLHCKDISEFLATEFSRRKQRNESYSLRAYARDLSISPSRLSEVLRGNHGLNEKTVDTIASKLKLRATERNFLKDLVLSGCSRSPKVRELAAKRVESIRASQRYQQIEDEKFKIISDWYHAAIVELTQLKDFSSDPKWISSKLGVSVPEIELAIERLINIGLMRRIDGRLVSEPDAHSAISEAPSSAIRKFHRQVMTMSIESLLNDSGDEREMLSMILAIPKSMMPEFRQEMRSFISEFWQRIESAPKDELYSISLQLCPVKNRNRSRNETSN